jgi:hypothetical protein
MSRQFWYNPYTYFGVHDLFREGKRNLKDEPEKYEGGRTCIGNS